MTTGRKPLKQRLQDGELVLAMGVAQARTIDVVLIAAACGFDSLWVDMEHTATSLETASMLCSAAIARGLAPVVRVPSHDPQYMTRSLDTGAIGIVVPHVDSAQEAHAIVDACLFPPLGHRSIIGPNAASGYRPMGFTDVVETANRETVLTAMIETPDAVARADEIAAVPGLDMILIGPADLTAEMGILGQFGDERFLNALARVAGACRAHSKALGIAGIKDIGLLTELVSMGLRYINVGNDTGYLMDGARSSIEKVRAITVPAR